MNHVIVKMNESCGVFEKDKIYDASRKEDKYLLFHHTGWYFVDKEMCKELPQTGDYQPSPG